MLLTRERLKLDTKKLIQEIREIIDHYDNHVNPRLKPGESIIVHHLKRLNPYSTQKFFCGKKGQIRADHFTKLLNAKNKSNVEKLRNLCENAYSEYEAAYNSWTAKQILMCIAKHLGLEKEVTYKKYVTRSAEEGTGYSVDVESESAFFKRVNKIFTTTYFEKEVEHLERKDQRKQYRG